jgi:DNA-directed RNA polymerase subunit RPC12/RpoP
MTPGGMPEVWHSYTCTPCRATLAIGGAWKAEVTCPSCGCPMQRLAEHRMEVTS